jgi:hypothetical protein
MLSEVYWFIRNFLIVLISTESCENKVTECVYCYLSHLSPSKAVKKILTRRLYLELQMNSRPWPRSQHCQYISQVVLFPLNTLSHMKNLYVLPTCYFNVHSHDISSSVSSMTGQVPWWLTSRASSEWYIFPTTYIQPYPLIDLFTFSDL